MKLVWSQHATDDRLAIFLWIAKDDPRVAIRVDERIEQAVKRLLDFPKSGRLGRIEGTRELTIAHTPYIAAYEVIGSKVRVLRVIHAARMWPAEFPEDVL